MIISSAIKRPVTEGSGIIFSSFFSIFFSVEQLRDSFQDTDVSRGIYLLC